MKRISTKKGQLKIKRIIGSQEKKPKEFLIYLFVLSEFTCDEMKVRKKSGLAFWG
jgi:hypothetical protein